MLRLMLVGYGYWGPNLARAATQVQGGVLVAISDPYGPSLDLARAAWPGLRFHADFRAGLTECDAVLIATPPHSHAAVASECMRAGKDVYIEKPITPSVREAEGLRDVAQEHTRILMVGHIYRYAPAVRAMAAAIDADAIGDVLYYSSVRANLGRFSKAADVIWDLLPHDLSVLAALSQAPLSSISCRAISLATPSVADVAYLQLRLADGRSCWVHDSWYEATRQRRFQVVGSRGAIVLDETSAATLTLYRKGVTPGPGPGGFEYFDEGFDRLAFGEGEPLVQECQHFVDSVAARKEPLTDAADGIRVLRAIEAAHASLAEGGAWAGVQL